MKRPGDLYRDTTTGEVVKLTHPSKRGPRGAWIYRVILPGSSRLSKPGQRGGGVFEAPRWTRIQEIDRSPAC